MPDQDHRPEPEQDHRPAHEQDHRPARDQDRRSAPERDRWPTPDHDRRPAREQDRRPAPGPRGPGPEQGRSPYGRQTPEPPYGRPRPDQGRPSYASPDLRRGPAPFLPPRPDQHGLAPYNRQVPGPFGPNRPADPRAHLPQPPFPPYIPPPPPQNPSSAASVLWAIAPLLTCGIATPFTMGYAAAKLKSTMLALSSAIYAIGMVTFVLATMSRSGPSGSDDALMLLAFLGSTGSWLGGTIHSLIIRNRVFDRSETPNDHAVAYAQHRRELRQQARDLVERDPALARELRIGRPDLPRQYDDGGLVDVNHASAEVIAGLPGMTAELARRVVEARADVGCFISAEDVSIAVDLPPHLTAELLELTIYLP
ncbi:helix-hairpin-helix domain-containing protein [Sphaerisporangium corydalis]|uniref:Helix-hairpin-helix domain-containing protein n=1 Tax=Sphaerisporangium corydalis TaxID=1441875 RepID=A0ABV9EJ91_9ACTN|nr:helix-hairpin-helix domain-containing protein [Sphaerisporangium corydalis]